MQASDPTINPQMVSGTLAPSQQAFSAMHSRHDHNLQAGLTMTQINDTTAGSGSCTPSKEGSSAAQHASRCSTSCCSMPDMHENHPS